MSDNKVNRRQFLERAAALGAAAVGAGTMLSACDPPEPEADQQAEAEADDFSCDDDQALAGLDEGDIQQRDNHEYTDVSPEEGEYCDNCLHWEPEGGEGGHPDCGGCAVLPGPVHPDGWCDLWAPMG